MITKWKPNSWRNKCVSQIPTYSDIKKLSTIENKIASYPPLIFAHEIKFLKNQLKKVGNGKAFLIHGGDCAENFTNLTNSDTKNNLALLQQISIILEQAQNKQIVKIGRIAGQFAKPRSSEFEIRGKKILPSYKGDMINGFKFNKNSRKPNPNRIEKAYFCSTVALNLIRTLSVEKFFLKNQLSALKSNFLNQKLEDRHGLNAHTIQTAIELLNLQNKKNISENRFYISHEALLLQYEEAMTRLCEDLESWYDSSAHFLWIGERTRNINEAHVEFLRGVTNPIAIKCSADITPEELIKLVDILNPKNEMGRLTIITRFGYLKIEEILPKLIRKIHNIEGRNVIWCCDPMHGNTFIASNGRKTRSCIQILSEAKKFINIHKNEGSYAGGIHLEFTGKYVTECIGGIEKISKKDLKSEFYETLCDPRLNFNQTLEFILELITHQKNILKPSVEQNLSS